MARPNQTESAGCLRPISQHTPKATARQPNSTANSNGTPGWPRSLDQLVDFGHARSGLQEGLRFSVNAVTPSWAQSSIMFTAMVWPASW